MDISVIVTSFNTKLLTLECLKSFFAQPSGYLYEVIVIDNNSSDGSADAIADGFPQVKLIRMKENLGFARANNYAVQSASGDYVLLLNPDTIILDDAVRKLYAFAVGHPEYGIYGGKTLNGDRTLNPTASFDDSTPWSLFCKGIGLSSLFRKSRIFNPEDLDWWSWDKPREVGIVTGCFLLIRRDLWIELDGFDGDFFMYGEDADLSLRSRASGRACVVVPEAVIVHYGGASEKVRSDKMIKLFRAKAQMYRKPYSRIPFRYGIFMLDCWAFTRMVALFLASRAVPVKRESFSSWVDIWRGRRRWHDI